ncbi:MAG: hypothetical protein H0X65_01915 [Gemmatimonadetes bacterium]|nr:hypothetical protein [Gemmatimonadota bacterium]
MRFASAPVPTINRGNDPTRRAVLAPSAAQRDRGGAPQLDAGGRMVIAAPQLVRANFGVNCSLCTAAGICSFASSSGPIISTSAAVARSLGKPDDGSALGDGADEQARGILNHCTNELGPGWTCGISGTHNSLFTPAQGIGQMQQFGANSLFAVLIQATPSDPNWPNATHWLVGRCEPGPGGAVTLFFYDFQPDWEGRQFVLADAGPTRGTRPTLWRVEFQNYGMFFVYFSPPGARLPPSLG